MKTTVKPPWVSPQWQCLKHSGEWPELSFGSWQVDTPPALQAAKERISQLEATNRWELVKKMVNPYEMVYTHEDPNFHPSIAVIKPLSRSYFKLIEMLEILQFFDKLPKQTPKIRTAHIAEGPGGFIQAVVDVTERNKKILQLSTAMTLKPTDQRVPGWRRASSFLHNHQEVRLHYGTDGTGDVYRETNQDSFVAAAGHVNLFTADGGFDFSINYDIQEQKVYTLLVCSATTGLRCLAAGGSFVLKLFDVSSESTMILIALMGRCFAEWTLYKPALSRPCNSERYFLGRGFKGLSPVMLKSLLEIQRQGHQDMYPIHAFGVLSPEEMTYIQENAKKTAQDQLSAIEIAEKWAENTDAWYTEQLARDFQTSLAWCQKFRVPYSITQPRSVNRVVYTSARVSFLPRLLPGGDSLCLRPYGPSGQALFADCSGHSLAVESCQTDEGSRDKTREVVS
jgi:23S rRNA U2552 (ribose-2'-O)-methylase RlmE/FtsJ